MPLPPDAPGGLCPQCLLKSDVPTSGLRREHGDSPRAVPIPGGTFGSYRIIRLLGQGGMGEVYEAEHVKGAHRVALKVMSHELGSEQDRKRFPRRPSRGISKPSKRCLRVRQ
jgi:serine/threonine protein kinase